VPSAECASCGRTVPDDASFCPYCGARLDAGATAAMPPPHLFGVTPATALLAIGLAAVAVGVILIVLDQLVLGLIVLAVGVLALGGFLSVARRKPDTAAARSSVEAAGRLRARAGFLIASLGTRSRVQRELKRLRSELIQLDSAEQEYLGALGEAVYRADDAAAASVRVNLDELQRTRATKEEEMANLIETARGQLERRKLQIQPTEVVEPPTTPEPSPVPHEPPSPPQIPEPSPVPHEPPSPPQIPEPSPEPEPEPTPRDPSEKN
jgi:hypothetical protein